MVSIDKINIILKNFKLDYECVAFSKLESGHINDTYLITIASNSKYVLQKINTNVFNNIEAISHNKLYFNNFIQSKSQNYNYQFIHFIETINNEVIYLDNHKNHWNLMPYIANSKTYDVANNSSLVFEAGKLYGNFLIQTSNISISDIKETLENFHSVPFRFSQFENALKKTEIDLETILDELNTIKKNKEKMSLLWKLKEQKKIPLRLTHNDTKLSNILFDKNEKGLAVIDLDTLMPGIIHFDFGDSVRSICATAKEDEQNLNLVELNLDYYEAYCKGYSFQTKNILNELEIYYLPLAIKTMIYIMGLRFFTDYLNGNIYYKIKYPNHNLDRAKNQFKLLQSIENQYCEIVEITNLYFAT